MPGSQDSNAFANNFMRGFSFVDDIKRQKVRDKQLEQRLAEDRDERAFQRRRTQRSDTRRDTLFGQQQEDRTDNLEEERLREEGDAFALQNPDASPEELAKYAPYSPEAAAAINRQNQTARVTGALQDVSTIGQNQPGAVTQSPNGPSLSESVAGQPNEAGALPTMSVGGTPAPAGFEEAFTQGSDKGTAGLQELNEGDFEPFDVRRKKQGGFRQFAGTVAGDAAQVVRGVSDAVMSPFRGVEGGFSKAAGAARESTPSAAKAELSGNIFVPADQWTDDEEFATMSEDQRAAATTRNQEIITEYHERGMNSSNGLTLGTNLGRTLHGSQEARKEAENQTRRATELFSDFVNPRTQGTLEQMAVNDPVAATQLYMEMRATGNGAVPTLMADVDARMVPVMQEAANRLGETAIDNPGSTQGRMAQNRLNNLQSSSNIVAKNQPPVSSQAGIRGGVRVGDTERAQNVIGVITDPNTPTVTSHSDLGAQAAATVVNNVTPNKRLNSRQIQGLATLVEAGYMNGDSAMSVMLSGHWPQTSVGVDKLQEFDGEIWATYKNGSVAMIRAGKAKPGDGVPNLEINDERLKQMDKGAETVFGSMTTDQKQRMRGLALHNPGWLRSTYQLDSEEHMMMAGRLFAQSVVLSAKEFKSREDSWFQSTSESPTPEQVFLNKEMRTALGEEHEVQLIAMPPVTANDGLDYEQIRIAARGGDYGPKYTGDAAQQLDKEALKYIYFVHNATPEQMQEANRRSRAQTNGFDN